MLSTQSAFFRPPPFQAFPQNAVASRLADERSLFPIYCPEMILSPELELFFKDGTLPGSNQEKGKLFLECFEKVIWLREDGDNSFQDQVVDSLKFILNDITHLDFSLATVCYNTDIYFSFCTELCNFIGEHFKGSALSFYKLGLQGNSGYANHFSKSCFDAVTILCSMNSNITSLSFKDSNIIFADGLINLVKAKNQLIELNLEGRVYCGGDILKLASALEANSTISVLNAGIIWPCKASVLALLKNKTITSLSFEDLGINDKELLETQRDVIAALEKNTTLISFNTNWCDPIDRNRCEEIMQRNLRWSLTNYYPHLQHILIFNREAEEIVPREIYQLILNQLSALIRGHR